MDLTSKSNKDTLYSLQWDRVDPGTALSGLPKICPLLRSSPLPHPERCEPCSETSAHFEWAHCGYTAGSSGGGHKRVTLPSHKILSTTWRIITAASLK